MARGKYKKSQTQESEPEPSPVAKSAERLSNEVLRSAVNFRSVPTPKPGQSLGNKSVINRGIYGRLGRPKNGADSRETMPVDENRKTANRAGDGCASGVSSAGWDGLAKTVRREEIPQYSFQNMKFDEANLRRALRTMGRMSADVAAAKNLVRRLANTGIIVSVKEYSDAQATDAINTDPKLKPDTSNKNTESEQTREDPVATRLAREMLDNAGQHIVSDIPGAMGDLTDFIDSLLDYGFTDGAMFAEAVLNTGRDKLVNMVAADPLTAEIRRDPDHPGSYLIGQKRWDVPGGWRQLNPNLVCYKRLDTQSIYGESQYITATHIIPLWMGYFGKLSIFLHRAAFGFLDGVVKVEVLTEMWRQVPTEVRAMYDDDFMTWAQAMVEFLAQSYKEQEEADPDAILAHLDLMEIKSEASGKASFPIGEAAKVLKRELHLALNTPGELMGEESSVPDRFVAMKIEAYHAYLKFLQDAVLSIINRFVLIGLTAMGYDKHVKPDCRFEPIPIDDRLTQAQALQLEQLCQRFLRDENIISQNEMARTLVGKPAIGPAPLSSDADPDGPSAPDREALIPRQAAKDAAAGHASGPSFGGAKKTGDSVPNQQQDKKM